MNAYEIWGGAKDGYELVLEDEELEEGDQVQIEEDIWYQLNAETGRLEIVR